MFQNIQNGGQFCFDVHVIMAHLASPHQSKHFPNRPTCLGVIKICLHVFFALPSTPESIKWKNKPNLCIQITFEIYAHLRLLDQYIKDCEAGAGRTPSVYITNRTYIIPI